MSQFYASIEGARGPATRTGSKASGITGHIRGWDVGARVSAHHTTAGEDEITVYATGGSNGGRGERVVATIRSNGRVTFHGETA